MIIAPGWNASTGEVMSRVLLLTLAMIMGFSAYPQANNYPNGSTVADFTVTDINGDVHHLYNYTGHGQYVMLEFFYDPCLECEDTQPFFNELYEMYGCNEADLVCIMIDNGNDSNAEVAAYLAAHSGGFPAPPAISGESGSYPVDSDFGVTLYPTYCLIDPSNIMVNNDIWPVSDVNTFIDAFPAGSGITEASCATSVSETEQERLLVYPNPTIDHLQIDGMRSGLRYTIVDARGAAVLSGRVPASSRVDVRALDPGMYSIELLTTEGAEILGRSHFVKGS
jgi:hypothetical protein